MPTLVDARNYVKYLSATEDSEGEDRWITTNSGQHVFIGGTEGDKRINKVMSELESRKDFNKKFIYDRLDREHKKYVDMNRGEQGAYLPLERDAHSKATSIIDSEKGAIMDETHAFRSKATTPEQIKEYKERLIRDNKTMDELDTKGYLKVKHYYQQIYTNWAKDRGYSAYTEHEIYGDPEMQKYMQHR